MYFNFPSLYIGLRRNYLPKIFSAYSKKKIISEVFSSISEVKQPISQHKKRRKPCVYGLSPLCYYKDNTFSRETQTPLTFRNT